MISVAFWIMAICSALNLFSAGMYLAQQRPAFIGSLVNVAVGGFVAYALWTAMP